MSKQKGNFPPGKYAYDLKWHVKGERGPKQSFFSITLYLTEQDVRETLLPQTQKFLHEIERQAAAKAKKAKTGK